MEEEEENCESDDVGRANLRLLLLLLLLVVVVVGLFMLGFLAKLKRSWALARIVGWPSGVTGDTFVSSPRMGRAEVMESESPDVVCPLLLLLLTLLTLRSLLLLLLRRRSMNGDRRVRRSKNPNGICLVEEWGARAEQRQSLVRVRDRFRVSDDGRRRTGRVKE